VEGEQPDGRPTCAVPINSESRRQDFRKFAQNGNPAPHPHRRASEAGRSTEERQQGDFEWRPGSGRWYRPGPIGQARIFGRRPEQGTYGVWSEALWKAALAGGLAWEVEDLPQIGADVARFGDDFTESHVRWGPVSTHHESANGWSTVRTAKRLAELADEWAERATRQRPSGSLRAW
jgi:hypothetical protein